MTFYEKLKSFDGTKVTIISKFGESTFKNTGILVVQETGVYPYGAFITLKDYSLGGWHVGFGCRILSGNKTLIRVD